MTIVYRNHYSIVRCLQTPNSMERIQLSMFTKHKQRQRLLLIINKLLMPEGLKLMIASSHRKCQCKITPPRNTIHWLQRTAPSPKVTPWQTSPQSTRTCKQYTWRTIPRSKTSIPIISMLKLSRVRLFRPFCRNNKIRWCSRLLIAGRRWTGMTTYLRVSLHLIRCCISNKILDSWDPRA